MPTAPDTWHVDTLLMSCRVMGRTLEHFMVKTLFDAAQKRGVRRLVGEYRTTAKNSMVANFWPQFGFQASGKTPQKATFERSLDGEDQPVTYVSEAAS